MRETGPWSRMISPGPATCGQLTVPLTPGPGQHRMPRVLCRRWKSNIKREYYGNHFHKMISLTQKRTLIIAMKRTVHSVATWC